MIGWMQNWDTCNLRDSEHLWFGQMSLLRELSIEQGRLYQRPVKELEMLRGRKVQYENVVVDGITRLEGLSGRRIDMELTLHAGKGEKPLQKFAVRFAQNDVYHTAISFRPHESLLKVDRKFSGSRRAYILCACGPNLSMTHDEVRRATKRAVGMAKESGALVSFDPNLRPPLWKSLEDAKEQAAYGFSQCDILKISDNEIQWFTGEQDFDAGIRKLREQYSIPLIMLSMGRDGSRAYYKDMRIEAASFLQEGTIETTGAGDTFEACCLHHVLKYGLDVLDEEKLTEMLIFANAAASIVTTRKGALRVMPEIAEVEALKSGLAE